MRLSPECFTGGETLIFIVCGNISSALKYVTQADKDFWYSLDRHLTEKEFDKKVRDHQGMEHYPYTFDEHRVGNQLC